MMHQATILFPILLGTLILFVWGRLRYDIVACIALMACILVGAVPYSMAFSGFANPAVITVACVMVISEAINRSGLIDYVAKSLTPVTSHTVLHIAALSILAAILSAFMNNVGALALLMPVAIRTSLEVKRSPSIVLMPLALGSALGGLTTSIGTPPNLLISSFREEALNKPFVMFDFAPVGLVCAAAGLLFVIALGWRLLPKRRKSTGSKEDMFQIEDYITEVHVPKDSNMIDSTIAELESLIKGDVAVVGIIRKKRKRYVLQPDEKIRANDILIVEAAPRLLRKLLVEAQFDVVGAETVSRDILGSDHTSVVEAVVPPGSVIEGRSSDSMRLRYRHRINLLAIARQGKPFKQRLHEARLVAGDILMLQGESDTLRETVVSLGLLPLVERGIEFGVKRSTVLPILIFLVAIVLAAFQILPVQIAFAGAVLGLVLTNVLPVRQLYAAIEWPVIVLLAAMIPVGAALETTGGTELIANSFVALAGHLSPFFILALLMIITMTLSDLMNNAATAVVMAPIGVSIAKALGLSVDPFLMVVAVGASCSFLTPIGHQNNVLVMGPGGYTFFDYFKIGIVLELIIIAVGLPMILWVWPI